MLAALGAQRPCVYEVYPPGVPKRPAAEQEAPERDPVGAALELLRANGGRVTVSRRLLLECLYAGNGHRTAEELVKEVRASAPDAHLSTIYRNLEELERLGVIEHAHLGHGPANYHLTVSGHGHLVCERCGTAEEAPESFFEDLARQARHASGFSIRPHHFAVVGLCRNCAEQEAAAAH